MILGNLLIFIQTFVMYWSSRKVSGTADETPIYDYQMKVSSFWQHFRRPFNLRFLTKMSHMAVIRFCGGVMDDRTVHAMRAVSIAMHAVSVIALHQGLSYVVPPAVALGAALLVALHPLATSTVISMGFRGSLLSGMLLNLALWALLSGHVVLAMAIAGAAILAKEDVVLMPLVLAVIALRYRIAVWPIVLLPQVYWVVAVKCWPRIKREIDSIESDRFMAREGYDAPRPPRWRYAVATAVYTLGNFPLWLLGFPYPVDPQVPYPSRRDCWRAAIALLIFLLAIAIGDPLIAAAGLLWMICSPLAIYPFVRVADPVTPNRTYVALTGFALLISPLIANPFVFMLLALVFFARTLFVEIPTWSNPWALWQRARRESPGKPLAYQCLGEMHYAIGEYGNAREALRAGLDRFPNNASYKASLAAVEMMQERNDIAAKLLEEARTSYPNCALAWENTGYLCEKRGQAEEAITMYRRAIVANEFQHTAHLRLGRLLYLKLQFDDALKCFAEAYRLRPNFGLYPYNVAATLVVLGRYDEALAIVPKMPSDMLKRLVSYPLPEEFKAALVRAGFV